MKSYVTLSGGMKETIDLIYPVGRTIICDHNPQDEYTWQKWEQDFKDVFPLGAGDTYAAGSTGGEAAHTLTIDEMPNHTHLQKMQASNLGITEIVQKGSAGSGTTDGPSLVHQEDWIRSGKPIETGDKGNNKTHNNMPPYKAVKFWTRKA